jgi:predicted nucleic acid-binding protein
LVDTNILSATAPTTAARSLELIAWMDTHSPDLYLSAIIIAEIADGIAKAKREGRKWRPQLRDPADRLVRIAAA